ncbi:hypothetical protein F5141DRAFT_1066826 [Pisolithus sp. B1]|nr:hypothetical protein F5141DRAFT_1066826 [Pisolithus sp. B1]
MSLVDAISLPAGGMFESTLSAQECASIRWQLTATTDIGIFGLVHTMEGGSIAMGWVAMHSEWRWKDELQHPYLPGADDLYSFVGHADGEAEVGVVDLDVIGEGFVALALGFPLVVFSMSGV